MEGLDAIVAAMSAADYPPERIMVAVGAIVVLAVCVMGVGFCVALRTIRRFSPRSPAPSTPPRGLA